MAQKNSGKLTVKKFLLAVFVILFMAFVAATVYVKFFWKDIFISALSTGLKRNVAIGDLYYRPPFGLSASKVDVENLFKADAVFIDLNLSSLIQRKIVVSNLMMVRPDFNIVNPVKPAASLPAASDTAQGKSVKTNSESTTMSVHVNKILIEDGRLKYVVPKETQPFSFTLEHMGLKAENLDIPFESSQTPFSVSAQLISQKTPLSNSKIESSGWVNLGKKDMDATVKILEASNHAALVAKGIAKDNVMKVEGDLDMSSFPSMDKNAASSSNINQIVYGALSNMDMKIGAKFSFETKLDDFEIDNISFSGSVVTP